MITEFKVSGMHCASCPKLIKMNVEELQGIKNVSGDEKKGIITVDFDEKKTNTKEIIGKIEQEHYKVEAQKPIKK